MFKKFIIILTLLFSTAVNAADIKDKANIFIEEGLGAFISNLIPGDGLTEASIDLRENYKPDFSFLGVRELKKLDDGNYFMQFSLSGTEQNNSERYVGNLGFGKRILSDDKTLLTGFNSFIDYDSNDNARASVGAEVKNAVLQLTSNYYMGIGDGTDEKVLDGYEVQLTSQVPYLHWANAFVSTYKWDGVDRDDIEGRKIGTELVLTPSFTIEAAYDDKDLKGLKDEYYARLIYTYPPKERTTALDGVSQTKWKEEKDMSGELLSKVKRQNKIMVEFKGSATISRLN